MKKDFTVQNSISESDRIVAVLNFPDLNLVQNLGTNRVSLLLRLKILGAFGFWRIKRK